jgi:hypothetical protein
MLTSNLIEWGKGVKNYFLKTYKRNIEGKEIEEKRENVLFIFYTKKRQSFFGIA